jgi:putative cardiolipin synthase
LFIDVDKALAAFDAHPNIDLRLFNAWQERDNLIGRGIEGLEKFEKLNARMHNIYMTAPCQ